MEFLTKYSQKGEDKRKASGRRLWLRAGSNHEESQGASWDMHLATHVKSWYNAIRIPLYKVAEMSLEEGDGTSLKEENGKNTNIRVRMSSVHILVQPNPVWAPWARYFLKPLLWTFRTGIPGSHSPGCRGWNDWRQESPPAQCQAYRGPQWMFVLLKEHISSWPQVTSGRWQRLGTRSFVWFLEKALPGMLLLHGGAEVPSWVHGGSCREASFSFQPLFPPQPPAGRSEARRPGTPGLGICTRCWECEGRSPAPTHSSWASRPPCQRRRSAAPWCWCPSAERALPPPDWHGACTWGQRCGGETSVTQTGWRNQKL